MLIFIQVILRISVHRLLMQKIVALQLRNRLLKIKVKVLVLPATGVKTSFIGCVVPAVKL